MKMKYPDIEDRLFIKLLPICANYCMATTFGAFEVLYSVFNKIKYIVENNYQVTSLNVETGREIQPN